MEYTFRYRYTTLVWGVTGSAILCDVSILAMCLEYLDDLFVFIVIIQAGVAILGGWGLVEGLVLRVFKVDEKEIRFYKHRSLKNVIPLERLKRVSFFLYDTEGGASKRIIFEPLSGTPIKIREDSTTLKHTKFDLFGSVLKKFCNIHQIPFRAEEHFTAPRREKAVIKKRRGRRKKRQRKLLLQKILQMTTRIDLQQLAQTIRLPKRQVQRVAQGVGLKLEGITLVKPPPRQGFIVELDEEFNHWDDKFLTNGREEEI